MRKIETQIEIKCSPAALWEALTDFKSYPEWNPFITYIEGGLKEGGRLRVTVQPPEGKKMSFSPRVIKVDREKKLSWQGKFLIKGVFDGAHIFEIIPLGKDCVLFIQAEYFSGFLVQLLWKSIGPKTEAGFKLMNQGLKKRLE